MSQNIIDIKELHENIERTRREAIELAKQKFEEEKGKVEAKILAEQEQRKVWDEKALQDATNLMVSTLKENRLKRTDNLQNPIFQ